MHVLVKSRPRRKTLLPYYAESSAPLAAIVFARRYRLSLPMASVIAELAGFAAHAQVSDHARAVGR